MQSAPNFIQGAMSNALKIQADPAAALNTAQKAFAGSGALALKLTALIDAEEKQAQDYELALADNVMQRERDIETQRNNLRLDSDRDAKRDLIGQELDFYQTKYNNKIEEEQAFVSEPSLPTSKPIGTKLEFENLDTESKHIADSMANVEQTRKQANERFDLSIKELQTNHSVQSGMGLTTEARKTQVELAKKVEQKRNANLALDNRKKGYVEDIAKLETERTKLSKTKDISVPEYKLDVNARLKEISEDPTMSPMAKLGASKRALGNKKDILDRQSTISLARAKVQAKADEEDKKQAGRIQLESIKYGHKASLAAQKVMDGITSSQEKEAFNRFIDDLTSGPYDSTIGALLNNERDLINRWNKEKNAK